MFEESDSFSSDYMQEASLFLILNYNRSNQAEKLLLVVIFEYQKLKTCFIPIQFLLCCKFYSIFKFVSVFLKCPHFGIFSLIYYTDFS